MKYIVPVYYTGLDHFIVEASTPEEAVEEARNSFQAGDPPAPTGSEYEDFDHAGEPQYLYGSITKVKKP